MSFRASKLPQVRPEFRSAETRQYQLREGICCFPSPRPAFHSLPATTGGGGGGGPKGQRSTAPPSTSTRAQTPDLPSGKQWCHTARAGRELACVGSPGHGPLGPPPGATGEAQLVGPQKGKWGRKDVLAS